jgi:hypothetical protein
MSRIENIIRKHCTATKKENFLDIIIICCVRSISARTRIKELKIPILNEHETTPERCPAQQESKTIMENLVNLEILKRMG